jgi:hypothetical protein
VSLEALPKCPVCDAVDCDHSDEERAAHLDAINSGRDRPYNAGDEEQVGKKSRAAKASDRQALEDIRFVMGDARGRRFVWSMLARCGVYRSSYLAGRGQTEATAFHEGERNVGLHILATISAAAPKAYLAMQQEAGS